MSIVRTPPAPRRRPSQSARAFAAARAEYLAGAEPDAVCRRHDIRLAYFLRIAGEQGWRRPDPAQPAAPDPASAPQNQPLVIPEASQASSGTPKPLTAAQMADKAWAMLSAAVAAGRLIEARGWLRLYKELKPFAREEADAERRARLDREAEQPREAVALPLHCFSHPECNTPDQRDAASTPSPSDSTGGSGHADAAELAPQPSTSPESPVTPGNDARTGDPDVALQLHCFSRPESKNAGPSP